MVTLTRSTATAAAIALAIMLGVGSATALRTLQNGATHMPPASATVGPDTGRADDTSASGPEDATQSDVLPDTVPSRGESVVEAAHPAPFETTDDHARQRHEQAVRDYLAAAYTFLPDDELGTLHDRASDTLHPDANAATTGILVQSVPRPGTTHELRVLELKLDIDTGSRTIWTATTRPVEMRDGNATPLPGRFAIATQITVTDWIDQPRVLEDSLLPQPVP